MRFMKIDAVAILLGAAILALTPTIGLAPARKSRLDAEALLLEAAELRKELLQTAEIARSIKTSIDQERRTLETMSYQGVERIPLNRRIAMINTVAGECGLEIIRLSPKRAITRDGEGPVRGIELSAMGSFAGVVTLLQAIESPELSLWAEAFEIRARQDRPGWVTISTDLAWHADSAGD